MLSLWVTRWSFAACPVSLFAGDLAAAEGLVAMLVESLADTDYHEPQTHSPKSASNSIRQGTGSPYGTPVAVAFEGVLLTKQGDVVGGVRLLRSALNELRETESVLYYTAFLSVLAEALAGVGNVIQGLTAIDEALARSESNKEQWCLAELLRIKGELLLLAGASKAAAAAEDHFGQALDWARSQGALSWELRTATSLARLRQAQGRTKDARELLAPIYDRFTEGFGTSDLRAAKALLGDLQ
jgi:predicted ATPase